MGVEDLREFFADTTAGASDNEDLVMSIRDAQYQRGGTYLSSLVWESLLGELSCWREGLAELVTHCCYVAMAEIEAERVRILTVLRGVGCSQSLGRTLFETQTRNGMCRPGSQSLNAEEHSMTT